MKSLRANRQDPFKTEHLLADLKGHSVRGGLITMVSQIIRFGLQMISTIVLARILTPADFGLIAMVAAVTSFVGVFQDFGLSMATVQRNRITHEQVSTLFWINVLVSIILVVLVAATAPVVAWFYGEPRLILVTAAIGGTFILGGLAAQHTALLQRQMRFTALAVIHVVAVLGGVVSGIVAAVSGAGYWSLVVMQVVSPALLALGVWLIGGWRPGLPARRSGVKEMLGFGANLTGFSVLNYFARNLDKVLIGKVWGANSLGLYSKAYSILMLPISQITSPVGAVAIPTLSRLQNDPAQYRRFYCRAINLIAFVTMPLMLLLAALSEELIVILLGEQWTDAAPIFKVLAFAALFQPVVSPVGWVYVSLGQTNRMLTWGLIGVPLIVLSFLVGLPWGAFGVAVSYTCFTVTFLLFPCLWWAFRNSPLTIRLWLRSVHRPLVLGLLVYGTIELLHQGWKPANHFECIILSAGAAFCILSLAMLVWRRAREEALDGLRILSAVRASRE